MEPRIESPPVSDKVLYAAKRAEPIRAAFVTDDGETVFADDARALPRHNPLNGNYTLPASRAAMLNKINRLGNKHRPHLKTKMARLNARIAARQAEEATVSP